MANLKEQEKWEDGVYQIEENDPVLGGENGITNKPIKQLANRTLWLKKALELFGKKSAPKDLTVESTSTADESGHSHKLPVGSTTEKGIWQATSDTGIDSDGLVLTAKAGKKLAQLIATVQLALNNYIPLKSRSSSVTSNDENGVATPKAVKTAYDKGVEAKNAADGAQRSANDGINRANNAKATADAAQRTANDANNNANTRQLKSELVGEVAFFARATSPSGWLKANGAAVSRTTYAALFAAIGTTFGAGDGSTTFNLPDLRGEFLRGVDDGRGVDIGRGLGSYQADEIKSHTINVPNSGYEGNVTGSWFYGERGNGNNNQAANTITYNGGKETRPRNMALLACIKY